MTPDSTTPCPHCGNAIIISAKHQAWVCSDPDCLLGHSDDGPGGGYAFSVLPLPTGAQLRG